MNPKTILQPHVDNVYEENKGYSFRVISGWFLVHSCRGLSNLKKILINLCFFRLCFADGDNMMGRLEGYIRSGRMLNIWEAVRPWKTAHGKWKPHLVSSLFLPSVVWSFCRLPIVTRVMDSHKWCSSGVHWLNDKNVRKHPNSIQTKKEVSAVVYVWLNTRHR